MKAAVLAVCLFAFFPVFSHGEPPSRPLATFEKAKKVARDDIYSGHRSDFYCDCAWTPNPSGSGGKIDPTDCGYVPRKNKARGKVLEWEHVMPAYYFGNWRACWTKGNARCVKSDGTRFKGRECCGRVDKAFQRIEADLHNLTPAVGELNGDRSNQHYGMVDGESRLYGACDFEIGGSPRRTEPRDQVRGDAARIWLYMSATYKIGLSDEQRKMFISWSRADPVDSWEMLRDRRVDAAQGNRNPFVTVTQPRGS